MPNVTTSTRVIMLGTGTPFPDPERSGPATAIIVEDVPYLVDFGPGVIRRAMAAYQQGVIEIGPAAVNIRTAFLTHLHSDHTMGYPDLMFTPWIMGRKHGLTVYGPPGLQMMTDALVEAWQVDITARSARLQNGDAWRTSVNEIQAGVVYSDRKVTVTAFPVHHHEMEHCFGFRFDTKGRSIVISGDTTPVPALVEAARGCDVLIHEAYSMASYLRISEKWQRFRRSHHTSSEELAAIASQVRPKLLVLYHSSNAGDPDPRGSEVLNEVRALYSGEVVIGRDLQVL
jgi:ribonuclease BN (tRNA processing enzyme)